MRALVNRLEESLRRIGHPKARQISVYDFGSKVRNFAGELAMKLADKSEPEGEMAANFPKVKQAGNRAIKALEQFATTVFDTEKSIDITPMVRGRLKEGMLDEKAQPRLNKYDPGSLLGWCVYLLEKEGLDQAADAVRGVSRDVSTAWQRRND